MSVRCVLDWDTAPEATETRVRAPDMDDIDIPPMAGQPGPCVQVPSG